MVFRLTANNEHLLADKRYQTLGRVQDSTAQCIKKKIGYCATNLKQCYYNHAYCINITH